MADNTLLNAGTGGDTIATDDISGVKFQRTKTTLGADGVNDGDVSGANPMPVVVKNTARTELRFYAVAATASAWDRVVITLPGDGIEIVGDGTLQFGVTAAATYTSNAPTWDVCIIGYEY